MCESPPYINLPISRDLGNTPGVKKVTHGNNSEVVKLPAISKTNRVKRVDVRRIGHKPVGSNTFRKNMSVSKRQ